MLVWNYAAKIRGEIEHWHSAGIVDESAKERMLEDVEHRQLKRSFASVLAIFGGVLIAAGLIAFVASNWESMPRYIRVILLVATIWTAYGLAAYTKQREHPYLTGMFLMIGIVAFGASIMLIGQIYQLQGRNEDALLVWMIGGLLTALGTRSIAALITTIVVSCMWMVSEYPTSSEPATLLNVARFYWYPAVWLVLAISSWWIGSRLAAHALAISMIIWLVVLVFLFGRVSAHHITTIQAAMLIIGSLCLASLSGPQFLRGFEIHALTYCFIVLLGFDSLSYGGLSLLRLEPVSTSVWPHLVPMVVAAIACGAILMWARRANANVIRDQYVFPIAALLSAGVIGLSWIPGLAGPLFLSILSAGLGLFFAVWSVRFGWRIGSRALSALGYLGFVAVLLITYSRVFGSLEFTAAIYGVAGIVLVVASIWLYKREQSKPEIGA